MDYTRRFFIKMVLMLWGFMAMLPWLRRGSSTAFAGGSSVAADSSKVSAVPFGCEPNGRSTVVLVRNGTPQQNVRKAVELLGGIERFVGPNDIVVLKPNAQWWSQGMTNTDCMQGFIDMVLEIPGFGGEIIIADNHQYDGENSRGWNTDQRNGRFNYNELVAYYQERGHRNVTKYHWRVAGKASMPLEGDAQGNSRVAGPGGGDGYVWMEDNYYLSPAGNKCLMTYPIFTSAYSGIAVDWKNGAWKNGAYLKDTRVRFINFPALNHHGWYCGVTAAVKNLMGVVDMTCGFPGDEPNGTYNTHFIGVSRLLRLTQQRVIWRIGRIKGFYQYCYRNFHYTGGVLGHFMRHVRLPDLNIIAAERVGWGSRIDVAMSFEPKAVLASRDPVALDFIAARDVLLPGTPSEGAEPLMGFKYIDLNNPEVPGGPLRKFLEETARESVGTLDPARIDVVRHDAAQGTVGTA